MMGTPFDLDRLRSTLRAVVPPGSRFGYQGLRATDAIAVEELVPLEFLVACDFGQDSREWDRQLRFFSLERGKSRRAIWTHSALVKGYGGPWGDRLRAYLLESERPAYLIPYRSTEFLEELAAASGGKLHIAANPVRLKSALDDKASFRQALPRLGLEPPPGLVALDHELSYPELRERLGPTFVAALPVGSAGSATFLVQSEDAWRAALEEAAQNQGPGGKLIVTRHLRGPSIGATALVFGEKVLLGNPSVQLSGVPHSAAHPFGYSGSDYSAYAQGVSRAVKEAVLDAALRVGRWLGGLGYRGIFGVDFVAGEGRLWPLEVNPRLLGTTQLMSELQSLAGGPPPSTFYHLAVLLGAGEPPEEAERENEVRAYQELHGFQLFLRNTSECPVRVTGEVPAGIYCLERGRPRYLRPGRRMRELREGEEFLLTCSVAERGKEIGPGAVFCKVQGFFPVVNTGLTGPSRQAVDLLEQLHQAFAPVPVEEAAGAH
ncbi:MAG: ATP-grasp domain-containing protein [Nitrospinota bacterium]